MLIEFRIDVKNEYPAYLMSLYEIIEELNCTSHTYIEEVYERSKRRYNKTRVVEVFGSSTMISWLLLRMQRYLHLVNQLNENKSVLACYVKEEE